MILKFNRQIKFLLLTLLIILFPCSYVLGQGVNSTQEGVEFIEGQIIVRFSGELGKSDIELILDGTDFQVKKVPVRRLNIYLLSIEAEGISTLVALEEIKLFPGVITAQLDHKVTMRQLFPDDDRFDDMWDMHNTGQLGGVEDADIDAPKAWEVSMGGITPLGDEIVIAVVDGGVDTNHRYGVK